MPPRLVLRFLGLPQIHLDDKLISMDRRKAIALLAYVAVNDIGHAPQEYSRESLSALLWPDYEQGKAFSNLRRTIWEIHQTLGENWLIAKRESVRLNPDAKIAVDVARFQDLLSQARQQTDISIRIPLLVEAIKVYRNHFLTGFSLKDAYPFNEWAFSQSEDLRRQLADALTLLIETYCALNQAKSAISYARRLVALDPLNESAHRQLMEVYLQAGQHNAALKQYQACEQILRKELNVDPQPETRALYKKIRKGEIRSVGVEKQIEIIAPKHNLPLQLSSFVGREKEQSKILRLLKKNRLVTLIGVGGIGKTRLALEVGQKLLNDYPDGVWFVPLYSLSNPLLVSHAVGSVFDIREGPDRSALEVLMSVLRAKTLLLILDNCEHLLDGCSELITALLKNCPDLKILATSREVIGVEGELVYQTSSLSLPEDQFVGSTPRLARYESIRLFSARAKLSLPPFTLTVENAFAITNICRRLDGIPLAIELAAAHVDILQPEEILQQLNSCFDILVNKNRVTPSRHQTMRTSMDWSWGLLTQSEQRFMQQLAVFAGGWILESARAVCDGDVLSLTSALARKSLIKVHQEAGRETRYYFHEIVRQYAFEKLVQSGEEADSRTQHLKYFLELCKQAEPALRSHEQLEWYAQLTHEHDNIRAALDWAKKTDVEAGLWISGSLWRFWEDVDLREGERWLEKFLGMPESHNYPEARAKALYAHGIILFLTEQYTRMRGIVEECLSLYRSLGDPRGEADGLIVSGRYRFATNDMVQADELARQALMLSEALGDVWRQAFMLGHLGWSSGNDYQQRISYFKQAVSLFRKAGDFRELQEYLGTLGNCELMGGDIESAQEHLAEAMQLSQNPYFKGALHYLPALGRVEAVKGNFEKARALLEKSVTNAIELGNRNHYLWNRAQLGHIIIQQGQSLKVREIFLETAQEFLKDKNIIGICYSLEGLAGVSLSENRQDVAATLIGWADMIRKEKHDRRPRLEQVAVDRIIEASLLKMGEIAFSDAYDEGQNMSLDEAVQYALAEHR